MAKFPIDKGEWFLLERAQRVDLFQSYPIIKAMCQNEDIKRNFGVSIKKGGVIISQDYSDMIFNNKEWEDIATHFLDLVKKEGHEILEKINDKIYNTSEDLNKYSDKILSKEIFSFEEARDSYEEFLNLINRLYSWAIFYEILELGKKKYLTQHLQTIIKEHLDVDEDKELGDNFITLTSATKDSWVEKERIGFLEIIENSKDRESLIKNHAKKFFFIPSLGSFESWDENYFSERVKESKESCSRELEKRESRKIKLLEKIAEAESTLNFNDKEIYIFQSVRELSFLKDFRRGIQNKAFLSVFIKIFPALSKKLKIKKENLRWMTLDEIKAGELDENEIESRIHECSHLIDGKEEKILNEIFHFKEQESKEAHDLEKMMGAVAYRGNHNFIKGKVNIILSRKDIKKFQKGDILVSHMTNPDIIEAISSAKAIITDEGGLTCHAAIVSRELEIPCIIGTKIATKVLKDGDLVEIDMKDGTVKILENN